jgi:hypothetical protein
LLVSSGRRDPAITALAEIRGFLVHQKIISQCGGLPGPFSTLEASLTSGKGNLTDSIKRLPEEGMLNFSSGINLSIECDILNPVKMIGNYI